MTVGIIIQARTGSKRFPRKVLALLAGKPVIKHVIERCQEFGEKVVLAVPYYDAGIFNFGVPTWYGPEDDVLERYYRAAKHYGLDRIIRITGDCPLIRADLIEKTYKLSLDCAYAGIDWPHGGWPKGYGVEIFDREVLNHARMYARDPYDREHVTPWMQRHVRCRYLKNDKDESHLNFCVDLPGDIPRLEEFLRKNKK